MFLLACGFHVLCPLLAAPRVILMYLFVAISGRTPEHRLKVSYCDHWMYVVRRQSCVVPRQQLLQMTSPPKLLVEFCPNLA